LGLGLGLGYGRWDVEQVCDQSDLTPQFSELWLERLWTQRVCRLECWGTKLTALTQDDGLVGAEDGIIAERQEEGVGNLACGGRD
jgi:hypothetical protein